METESAAKRYVARKTGDSLCEVMTSVMLVHVLMVRLERSSVYFKHAVLNASRMNALTITSSGEYGDVRCGTSRAVVIAFAATLISAVRSMIAIGVDCAKEVS